jgi:hypothetical protein
MMMYQYDWLGAWISRSTRPGSILRLLPTSLISLAVDTVRGIALPLLLYYVAVECTGALPGMMAANPLTLLGVVVVTLLLRRFVRLSTREPIHHDGYVRSQTFTSRFAAYIWRLCSCERSGPHPVPRRRSRRTLG